MLEVRRSPASVGSAAQRTSSGCPLQAILDGSPDTRLADDPNIDYDDAAELLLLTERLGASSEAGA
jgi:hypothetical protein